MSPLKQKVPVLLQKKAPKGVFQYKKISVLLQKERSRLHQNREFFFALKDSFENLSSLSVEMSETIVVR